MEKTLYDLKDGDYVLNRRRWHEDVLLRVNRQTPQYIFAGRDRYRKKDGKKVCDYDGLDYIEVATEENIEEIRKKKFHDRLATEARRIDWDSLKTEQLEAVLKIAKEKNHGNTTD